MRGRTPWEDFVESELMRRITRKEAERIGNLLEQAIEQFPGKISLSAADAKPVLGQILREMKLSLRMPEFLVALLKLVSPNERNPFFIEEMVQALFEQGVLQRNGALKLTRSLNDIRVPSSVPFTDRGGADQELCRPI
jgi:hypothetical protein